MRICLVHNHYGVRAGEEVAVETIQRVLAANGHEVTSFSRCTTDVLRQPFGKLKAFVSGIWNSRVAHDFAGLLSAGRPDVIQVQNVFPAISPAVFEVAQSAGIPVVMRCSNYRLFCPTGLLMCKRTCAICERCVGGNEYWCVLKNCEASLCKSVGYALRTAYHRVRATVTRNTSAFYCPSMFLKRKLVGWGIPEQKTAVIPTPVQDVSCSAEAASLGTYIAYVGRISPEKGVDWLLNAASKLRSIPFKLAGRISQLSVHTMSQLPENVTWVGELGGSDLNQFYSSARIVVIPSICYEVFPNVGLEAMVRARPVVASRIGGIPELVDDGSTGLLVSPRAVGDLVDKLHTLWSDKNRCDSMGEAGRSKALHDYSEERFYTDLKRLYQQVIQEERIVRNTSRRQD